MSGRRLAGFLTAAFLAAGLACSGSVASERLANELARNAGGAVWAVNADGCGWRMHGSAFAVDARHLVTNRHVVANDSTPTIKSREGTEIAGKVIGSSEKPDVAVIEVTRDLPMTLGWAATADLSKGEPLVTIGYPMPDKRFTASPGQIVNFQGPNDTREAALANTPIERGNSGGPGLRADGSVAGVATMMLLREGSPDRVAILFTADTVRPTVDDYIRSPRYVRSTCGLGPDYVPPVPKTYDIPEPPPTAEPLEPLPLATVAAPEVFPPSPTADPLANYPQWTPPPRPPCPTGNVQSATDEVTATEKPDEPGWWTVHVKGRVVNRSSDEIYIDRIDIEIKGDPPVTGSPAIDAPYVAPEASAPFEFGDVDVHSPDGAPTKDSVRLKVVWRWTGQSVSCPTPTPTSSPTT